MNPENDTYSWLALDARPEPIDTPDAVKRRELPLDRMPMQDGILATAYQYWTSKSRPSRLPSRGDIDILDIVSLIKHLHLVDVSEGDPNDWYFRIIGAVVPKTLGWDGGRDKVSSCPWPVYKEALLEDYATVKAIAAPLYQEVALRLDNHSYEYARLLLPLAADGRQVDALMSCVFLRATPGLTV